MTSRADEGHPILAAIARQPVITLWPPAMPGIDPAAAEQQDEPAKFRNIRNPTLTVYEPEPAARNGTAAVVCPGGGYGMVSCANEGHPIARWLNGLGICAYVLKYRLSGTVGIDYRHPVPLADAQQAMRIVRRAAPDRGVRTDRIGVVGFSAGGHLAAMVGTLFEEPVHVDPVSCRPDFSILLYPVMTLVDDAYCHGGSRTNLLGPKDTPALRRALSPELRVTSRTPPAFLAHARDDKSVPYQNSVIYHEAMQRHGVPSELHLYQQGGHGFGLGAPGQDAAQWPTAAAAWLRTQNL